MKMWIIEQLMDLALKLKTLVVPFVEKDTISNERKKERNDGKNNINQIRSFVTKFSDIISMMV